MQFVDDPAAFEITAELKFVFNYVRPQTANATRQLFLTFTPQIIRSTQNISVKVSIL